VRKTVETTFVGRPVIVTGLEGVTALAAGDYHTCAVLRDGTVKCWGDNEYGQLGNDSTSNSNVPVAVAGIRNAIGIAAGMQHTCALLADETVSCWGNNGRAQLGS
jgi:alpha-tubulin suppressor-like RCC1 family protein